MANAYRVLGQVSPAADTDTTLYTVPADTEAVVSSIVVAMLTTGYAYFRIAVRPGGESLASKHYVAYQVALYEGTAQTLTLGLTLGAGDVVTVRSSASAAFGAFGSEITP